MMKIEARMKTKGKESRAVAVLLLALCAALCVGMFACLSACKAKTPEKPNSQSVTLANPMMESTQAGVAEATGIDIAAPEGAENVAYFYYKASESTMKPLAEISFTLDGNEAYLRAQKTDLKSFPYTGDEIVAAAISGKNLDNGADITGMHCSWETFSTQDVGPYDARCFRGGEVGYIAWIDSSAGVLYNLCMKSGATDDALLKLANAAFTAIQKQTA